jgi:hypothetical protein
VNKRKVVGVLSALVIAFGVGGCVAWGEPSTSENSSVPETTTPTSIGPLHLPPGSPVVDGAATRVPRSLSLQGLTQGTTTSLPPGSPPPRHPAPSSQELTPPSSSSGILSCPLHVPGPPVGGLSAVSVMPIASAGIADAVVCPYGSNGSQATLGQWLGSNGLGPLIIDIEALHAAPPGFHPKVAPDVIVTLGYANHEPVTVEVATGHDGYVVTPRGTWVPSERLLQLLSSLGSA